MCDRIKAPYNFVPLNGYVYIPEWADKISQDIPFSDGEDGMITVTFRNETPLFIHSGMNEKEAKNPWSEHVVRDGKKLYFLPATSIKGMVRSVMEVLSFAALDTFNDDYFGYRNFDIRDYRDRMEGVRCGWLRKENDCYYLKDCGIPEKISIAELKLNGCWHGERNPSPETILRENCKHREYINRKIIVYSGSINGKKHEHLFPREYLRDIRVNDVVIRSFLSAYKPSPYFDERKDVNVMKLLASGQEVPVFFIEEDGEISCMGLTRMFRMPYKHHIAEAIRQKYAHSDGTKCPKGHDMCQCIFGFTDPKQSLRGRVQFGHAFAEKVVADDVLIRDEVILGTPSPSYYPLYLKHQNGKYTTYDNPNIEIAGRKRYRIHETEHAVQPCPEGDVASKVTSILRLLPAGNDFVCRISVHNLREVEIGALLSSLTFHRTESVFHNIGKGKSLGYGKLRVTSVSLDGFGKEEEEYLRTFEQKMTEFTKATANMEWSMSEQVKMLMQIASEHGDDFDLGYMSLDGYKKFKRQFDCLKELTVKVKSFTGYNSRDFKKEAIKKAEELFESEKYQDALNTYRNLLQQIGEDAEIVLKINELSDYISSLPEKLREQQLEEEEKKRRQRSEQGLSFLEEKYVDGPNKGAYKVKDFKVFQKKIETWMKNSGNTTVPEDQEHYFIDALKRIYSGLKEREKKDCKTLDSKVWKFVRECLGEEKCSELFSQLIG